jgi:glyoxylase-like metal-dependent hydrolase (beta-lactamase superfamily II)
MRLPASMQVFERGWLSANNILFIGRDGTTLVDSGYVTHAPQTLALLRHALDGRPLDRIVNTHLHSDHCGGNAALKDAFGCRIAIPVFEAGKVRRGTRTRSVTAPPASSARVSCSTRRLRPAIC